MKEMVTHTLGPTALPVQVGQNQSHEPCPGTGPQQPRNVQGTASSTQGRGIIACCWMLGPCDVMNAYVCDVVDTYVCNAVEVHMQYCEHTVQCSMNLHVPVL